MARVKEKKERSLGTKLFLKAERCVSPKCVMVRKPYRPGQHGQKRRRPVSDYGRQLQEKQKIQIYYNLTNRQMRNLFKDFNKEKVVNTLEHRLDQVAFKLGLAPSPRVARQLISHGHIVVNDRKTTVSSFNVKVGDEISIKPASRELKVFGDIHERLKNYEPPSWLKLDKSKLYGKCVAKSSSAGEKFPFDVDLVGQFYAR